MKVMFRTAIGDLEMHAIAHDNDATIPLNGRLNIDLRKNPDLISSIENKTIEKTFISVTSDKEYEFIGDVFLFENKMTFLCTISLIGEFHSMVMNPHKH